MKRLSLFALLIALGLGIAPVSHGKLYANLQSANVSVRYATDGAFRDGLYLGRLAAESGAESHIAIGRWATVGDRASFTAGYQQGYNEFLAGRVTQASRLP